MPNIYRNYLEIIKTTAGRIRESWDGDSGGLNEERADCAGDIINKCNEILELFNELDN